MKKKILLLLLAFAITTTSGSFSLVQGEVCAATKGEGEDKKTSSSSSSLTNESIRKKEGQVSDAKKEQDALKAGSAGLEKEVNALESAQAQIEGTIKELDAESDDVQKKIDELDKSISENEIAIDEAKTEVDEAKAEVDNQYESMKKRIRFMYEAGNSTLLEIVFASTDFGDFLNNAVYAEKIASYDEKKLTDFKTAQQKLQEAQAKLEKRQKDLEQNRKEQQDKADELNSLMSEKSKQVQQYEALIGTKEQQIDEYKKMIAAQDAQIKALESAIAAEKQALAAANKTARTYDGGMFAFPAPSYTRISDDYGMRMHPTLGVEMMHNGIDLAAPAGSPILAAYDGTVVAAAYSASMGNYVMIDHGSGLITIYMHASALNVSAGQSVTKGQKIAAVGSTGRSTGPHLHFGVRKDGAYVSPWNYLG